jgi:major membrane immunogen (membrane-anchored lipoprotein)
MNPAARSNARRFFASSHILPIANTTGSFEVATSGAKAFSGATAEAETAEGEVVSVDAITGATVTSKAVVRSVNSAVSFVTGADLTTEATSWGG